jgi:DNA-binding ferritin-like protein
MKTTKRRLSESMEMMLSVEPNLHIVTDNMMAEWGSTPYPQLSMLLVHLKYLYALHQNHHWTSMGDPFYGDHLLFQRLYQATVEEIDGLAEKAIGLGNTTSVNLTLQTSQLLKLVTSAGNASMIPASSDLAKKSLMAEMNFLKVIDVMISYLQECGLLTSGLSNMLEGIADVHEGHIYLLKQRVSKPLV